MTLEVLLVEDSPGGHVIRLTRERRVLDSEVRAGDGEAREAHHGTGVLDALAAQVEVGPLA